MSAPAVSIPLSKVASVYRALGFVSLSILSILATLAFSSNLILFNNLSCIGLSRTSFHPLSIRILPDVLNACPSTIVSRVVSIVIAGG